MNLLHRFISLTGKRPLAAVAVQLTEDFFPELIGWLESQPAVKKAAVK